MEKLFSEAVFTDEDDPSDIQSTRTILAYSQALGRLFVAADDGSIRSADVRQQLLTAEWEQGTTVDRFTASNSELSTRTLIPRLELNLNIESFALSRSGTFAAIAGPTLADPEITAVYIIDITARHPIAHDSASCDTVSLDPFLFSTRPGLRVLQLAWHPDSEHHLAVLTSDAAWRLYDTQRPDVAEQTFELGRSNKRRVAGLDDLEQVASKPIAFAFGTKKGWDRFSVYFISSSNRVYRLCPVVPFGCHYPSTAIDSLDVSEELLGHNVETADAWLQRAFQPAGDVTSPTAATSPSSSLLQVVTSVPHALDEHVAALVGPLPVTSIAGNDTSPAGIAGRPGVTEDVALWQYNDKCTAIVTASATGVLGAYVLLGSTVPCWGESKPQCIVDNTGNYAPRAVRSQVPKSASDSSNNNHQQELLLLDVMTLPLLDTGSNDEEEGVYNRHVAIRLDAAVPETLYCIHPKGVSCITLPWLPILGESFRMNKPVPAVLPAPVVEEVWSANSGVLDAAPVGDALCGTALIVLNSDGSHGCIRHTSTSTYGGILLDSSTSGKDGTTRSSLETLSAAAVETHVKQTYDHLLTAPSTPSVIKTLPKGVDTESLEGKKLLTETVAALRSTHIEFIHQAQLELSERLQQIQAELLSQQERIEKLHTLAEGAVTNDQRVGSLAERVVAMQSNLSSRLRLLAELHWALPRPTSEAESKFARQELPSLESASSRLKEDVAVLCATADKLIVQHSKPAAGSADTTTNTTAGALEIPVVPLQQLRKVRQILMEHEKAIKTLFDQAELCEQVLVG